MLASSQRNAVVSRGSPKFMCGRRVGVSADYIVKAILVNIDLDGIPSRRLDTCLVVEMAAGILETIFR